LKKVSLKRMTKRMGSSRQECGRRRV